MRHISVNVHATSCTWLGRETANTKCFWIWSNSPNLIPANFFYPAILYIHTVSMVSFQPCQLYEAVLRISSLKISKGQNIFLSYGCSQYWHLCATLTHWCTTSALVSPCKEVNTPQTSDSFTLLYHEEISGLVNMLCTLCFISSCQPA